MIAGELQSVTKPVPILRIVSYIFFHLQQRQTIHTLSLYSENPLLHL